MYFTLGNEVYHVLEHKQFVDLAYYSNVFG
jgi:hypothetical protein